MKHGGSGVTGACETKNFLFWILPRIGRGIHHWACPTAVEALPSPTEG